MAALPTFINAIPVPYPDSLEKEKGKKVFKKKEMRKRPETLFYDIYRTGDACDLIFYTGRLEAWKTAVREHFNVDSEGRIQDGFQIKVRDRKDPKSATMSINFYGTGTVIVQKENIPPFDRDFRKLKKRVEELSPSDIKPDPSSSTDKDQSDQEPEGSKPTSIKQENEDEKLLEKLSGLKVTSQKSKKAVKEQGKLK